MLRAPGVESGGVLSVRCRGMEIGDVRRVGWGDHNPTLAHPLLRGPTFTPPWGRTLTPRETLPSHLFNVSVVQVGTVQSGERAANKVHDICTASCQYDLTSTSVCGGYHASKQQLTRFQQRDAAAMARDGGDVSAACLFLGQVLMLLSKSALLDDGKIHLQLQLRTLDHLLLDGLGSHESKDLDLWEKTRGA